MNTKRPYLSGNIGDLLLKSQWSTVLTCDSPLVFRPKILISGNYHLLSIQNLVTFFWDRIFKLGLLQKFGRASEIRSFLEFFRRNANPRSTFFGYVPGVYTWLTHLQESRFSTHQFREAAHIAGSARFCQNAKRATWRGDFRSRAAALAFFPPAESGDLAEFQQTFASIFELAGVTMSCYNVATRAALTVMHRESNFREWQ